MSNTPRVHVHYMHEARRPHPCPTCDAALDGATHVEEGDSSPPVPGSIVLCLNCGHASVFTPELLLRQMLAQELRAACDDPMFIKVFASMAATRRAFRHAHGKPEL